MIPITTPTTYNTASNRTKSSALTGTDSAGQATPAGRRNDARNDDSDPSHKSIKALNHTKVRQGRRSDIVRNHDSNPSRHARVRRFSFRRARAPLSLTRIESRDSNRVTWLGSGTRSLVSDWGRKFQSLISSTDTHARTHTHAHTHTHTHAPGGWRCRAAC